MIRDETYRYMKLRGDLAESPPKEVGFLKKFLWTMDLYNHPFSKTYDYIFKSSDIWQCGGGIEQTENLFLEEFTNHLTQNPSEINDNRVFHCHAKESYRSGKMMSMYRGGFAVSRTPLELAIERGAPLVVIMKLLENGAKPTNTACSMAMLMYVNDWELERADRRKNDEVEKIIELLSFAGADWSEPCGHFVKRFEDDHPSSGIATSLAHFITHKFGEQKAGSLGVVASKTHEHKIDLDKFAEKVRFFRNKRIESASSNADQVKIKTDVELVIPEKSKERWGKHTA